MIAGSSTPLSILTLPITVGRAAVYWRSRNIAKMQTIPICAFMGVGHASTWLDSRIEKQLLRFPGRHRIAVLALAQRDARLADLALSFPALLFALAVPRHGFEPDMVIKQVQAGASIKNMGRLTGLPWWSRRLRPEAFQDKLERLPDGEPAARQIVNHLPRSTKLAPKWLAAVSSITKWGTPDAAIWIAREMLRSSKAVNVKRLHLISLYAWYSGRPDTLGASLIRNCWRPSMSFATALRHAGDWLESLALYAQLGDQAIDDVWLSRASVDGFEFVPLCTADEIRAEALAMQNCVRTLGDGISCNCYRLWSVRCGGTRVATLSVGYRYCDPLLQIAELKGPKNQNINRDVWWSACRWLHSHSLAEIMPFAARYGSVPPNRKAWIALWRLLAGHAPYSFLAAPGTFVTRDMGPVTPIHCDAKYPGCPPRRKMVLWPDEQQTHIAGGFES